MDGCFDLTHFGHANALRQAKACGDELVVGLVGDAEILRCKGPPVLREAERRAVVESIKWVDEMLLDVPYDINAAFMHELYTTHRIDFIVHGDDPCILPDGTDAYDAPKKAGKFKMIKRTEGISTTDIVGRVLIASETTKPPIPDDVPGGSGGGVGGGVSHFCTTSRRIIQFSNGGKAAPAGARVVYVHGAFDLFHAGHVHMLHAARQLGDFLLVGVHGDAAVRSRRGAHHPILNVHERALGVMACTHVDEVVIGAPQAITRDLVTTFNVSVVVAETEDDAGGDGEGEGKGGGDGMRSRSGSGSGEEGYQEVRVSSVTGEVSEREASGCQGGGGHGAREYGTGRAKDRGQTHASSDDPNAVARELGIFREVAVAEADGAQLSTADIIRRVATNRQEYEARNARKGTSEATYYEKKASGTIELAYES